MNAPEQGFLLLTGHLGDPERKPMTVAQLRNLAQRVHALRGEDFTRELEAADLLAMGYDRKNAQRILDLLDSREQLDWYVREGKRHGCVPITRVSPEYPACLKQRMGLDSPGCLWAKGDLTLLGEPAIALVGSRTLNTVNEAFAWETGRQAALQGFVLVSGNARGADRTAQDSALAHGGKVICVVANALQECPLQENVLYLSEEGYDLAFSPARALSRNRTIHSLGSLTIVAQCSFGTGGTWDGSVKNLKQRYSPLFVLDDCSEGAEALIAMGAEPMMGSDLEDLSSLKPAIKNLIDQ